ncbi:MAG: transcription-repair coupling factor [Anaerolineales bacterium]
MNLSPLLAPIRSLEAFDRLKEWLASDLPQERTLRVPRAARPTVTAALAGEEPRPVLVLVSRTDRLLTLAEELQIWDPALKPGIFPEPNPLFYESAPWGPRTRRQRVSALFALAQAGESGTPPRESPIILAPARGVMSRSLPPSAFNAECWTLEPGHTVRIDQLLTRLLNIGYAPNSVVTQPGQFSRRGGIVDLWPSALPAPARLDFFGDELDTLRQFDPESQRSLDVIRMLKVMPAREGLPREFDPHWKDLLPPQAVDDDRPNPEEPFLEFFIPWMWHQSASLLDYIPSSSLVLMDDRLAFEEAVDDFESQAVAFRQDQIEEGLLPQDSPLTYVTRTEISESLDRMGAVDLGMATVEFEPVLGLGDAFEPGPRFGGQVRPLIEHLGARVAAHETCVVVSRQASRLNEIWRSDGGSSALVEQLPDELLPGDLFFLQEALSEGWTLRLEDSGAIHLLTDSEIFGWARPRPRHRQPVRAASPEASYADLKPGDFVVHIDYGIGRLQGLVQRTLDSLAREYLLVEYAGGAQVYVPVHQADRLTRYVGVEGSHPKLSSLGSTEWERVKGQAAEAVQEIAQDLLDLYARRMAVKGYAYGPDSEWQRELEASFPYVETDDQLHALEAVKSDMEGPQPMDRLICGDVGYGKTEVALRAAFKAVMEGRQAAVLVPTTVLAQQHFTTFKQRLAPFPVTIEMLSRFRSRSEAQAIVARLAAGEVDIVVGTHRLLQKDVEFKNLGLLIIDEEQRFGVTHKEYLKRMRTEVDVLTLTATPIPRTLYMALTGARDISTINTPPEERLPVITYVGHYEPRLIRQAVLREVDRGGQVFFVHNRVQTINTLAHRLEKLVPEARLGIAHGQMPEAQLANVMQRFSVGEIDLLVSTSIIESGLDIPNANTLIVDRADMFGLAQLYQLRGRVGRSSARAYAYFLRHPQDHPSEEAQRRLEIIAENSQLGSGYSIALRDLEMRGAGDILGTRQHGHIVAIGFHLYTRLLATAVRRLRHQTAGPLPRSDALAEARAPLTVSIELPLASAIPTDYVEDRDLRLRLYRRMAETRQLSEVEDLQSELVDRFGPLPSEVENLLYQLKVRILAARAQVEGIGMEGRQILLRTQSFSEDGPMPELGPDLRLSRKGLWLLREGNPNWPERLLEVLDMLGRIHNAVPA